MIQNNEKQIEMKGKFPNEENERLNVHCGNFKITTKQLTAIFKKYKDRKAGYEDLEEIAQHQGDIGLMNKLQTHPESGIASTDNREDEFGSNKVYVKPVPHFCEYVWDALGDMMLRILIFAAVVQIALGSSLSDSPERDWIDGLSIVIAVVVVVLVGSITNWKKEHKFHELNVIQNKASLYTIIRNGKPGSYIADDILVGDLLKFEVGDIFPADAVLISGNRVSVDESSLTGESEELKKCSYSECLIAKEKEILEQERKMEEDKNTAYKISIPSPMLLSGTNCIEGSGTAIILAVGQNSLKGEIRGMVDNSQEDDKTPLEEKLDVIAGQIGWFGIAAGVVTLVALFIRFGISYSSKETAYYATAQQTALFSAYLQNNPSQGSNSTILNIINATTTNPKLQIASHILDIILLCISIIVVAIPEGLPLAVTLSLAFSIKKMMDMQNLVRKMDACETMGGANYICTDKTGTLTMNEMSVVRIFDGKRDIEIPEAVCLNPVAEKIDQRAPKKKEKVKVRIRESHAQYFNDRYFNMLKLALACNITATINTLDRPNEYGDTEEVTKSNKTDLAFIDFLYRLKTPIIPERKKYYPPEKLRQFPFSSERKRMSTILESKEFPTGYRLLTKGAADYLLKSSTHYYDPDTNEKKVMQDNEKENYLDMLTKFNNDALRCLCICYKDLTREQYDNWEESNKDGPVIDKSDLVLIGICGIRDVLRENVSAAVKQCHLAGVDVIMVTGDNIYTAVAIAKQCGILDKNKELQIEEEMKNIKTINPANRDEEAHILRQKNIHRDNILKQFPDAMTGSTFYHAIEELECATCLKNTSVCTCAKTQDEAKKLGITEVKKDRIKNIENFKILTKNLKVLARSEPIHKYALVLGLRSLNHVVAVTGDGTNDAPALSRSNVGFAMGKAGTDIAKAASDIIILDDDFSSIVSAILWGRNIYDNIRKFLQFQLTVNFCACLLVFICACIGNETPLVPIQMLWVNLIMDSLGSLALATEPPYDELLRRRPTKRLESIINGKMWKHIIIQSMVQLGLLLFLYLYGPNFIKEDDFIRLAESETIKRCYGTLPGNISDTSYILFGTETQWVSSIKLKRTANEHLCGGYANKQDLSVALKYYIGANGGSAHMTIVFNVFVFYTLFNQINARILDDNFNIFQRIHKNFFFPLITAVEAGLQVAIILIGNSAFHVCETGLTGHQWGICIGFAATTWLVSIIIKLIPLDRCIQSMLDKISADEEISEQSKDKVSKEDISEVKDNKIANINDLAANKEIEKLNLSINQGSYKIKKENSAAIVKNLSSKIRNPGRLSFKSGSMIRSNKKLGE